MYRADLVVEDPSCWIADVAPKLHLRVRILAQKLVDARTIREVVELTLPETAFKMAIEAIRRSPSTRNVWLAPSGPNRLVGTVECVNCSACRLVRSSDCWLVSAESPTIGSLEWQLLATDPQALRRLVRRLEEAGVKVTLTQVGRASKPPTLTPREREVLLGSIDLGYFDDPRRVNLSDLAQQFGITKAALSETLRRAQRKVLVPLRDSL